MNKSAKVVLISRTPAAPFFGLSPRHVVASTFGRGLPDLWNRAARRGLPGRRPEIHDTVKQRLSHFAFGKPRLF